SVPGTNQHPVFGPVSFRHVDRLQSLRCQVATKLIGIHAIVLVPSFLVAGWHIGWIDYHTFGSEGLELVVSPEPIVSRFVHDMIFGTWEIVLQIAHQMFRIWFLNEVLVQLSSEKYCNLPTPVRDV